MHACCCLFRDTKRYWPKLNLGRDPEKEDVPESYSPSFSCNARGTLKPVLPSSVGSLAALRCSKHSLVVLLWTACRIHWTRWLHSAGTFILKTFRSTMFSLVKTFIFFDSLMFSVRSPPTQNKCLNHWGEGAVGSYTKTHWSPRLLQVRALKYKYRDKNYPCNKIIDSNYQKVV